MVQSVGQILDDKHRIVNVFAGGMAYVYIIENLETGEKRAAKTVRDEFLNDSVMVARFRREMRIWVGVGQHPNIVRAFSVKDIGNNPFLFMQYIDGGSLLDIIKKRKTLSIDRMIEIAQGIACGMNYVHNCMTSDGIRGIVHRDLTPGNVMLTQKGEIKISDFGLARAVDTTLLTRTCDMLGTVPYISPEQFFDSHAVDKRTDIYSFGALMYHLTCGVPPFTGKNWNDLVEKIRNFVPVAPAEIRKDVPEALSHAIMRCLEKKIECRFTSFDEIMMALCELEPEKSASDKAFEPSRSLNAILDTAEKEAAATGNELVDPAHLLISVASRHEDVFSSWFDDIQIDQEDFAENIKSFIEKKDKETAPGNVRFKRSTQRVMALARTYAEQDGLPEPKGKHVLLALLQEASVQEIMAKALSVLRAPNLAMGKLLEIVKKSNK